MKIQPTCLSCLIGQIEKAIRLLRPNISDDEIVAIQKRIMSKISQIQQAKSVYYGQALYQAIGEEIGDHDPYHEIKKKYNQMAYALAPRLRKMVRDSQNPKLGALILSILGNVIDFGAHHTIDIEEELKKFDLRNLAVDHHIDLLCDLETANSVMIIGDNSGEIVFDMIMLESFHHFYPNARFYYAVRGGPAINDVTMTDAMEIGLDGIATIVETSASPGIIFDECSMPFKNTFFDTDLIISKGQGNFESLDDCPPCKAQIYFLLRAKCSLIADTFKVKIGDLILDHQQKKK